MSNNSGIKIIVFVLLFLSVNTAVFFGYHPDINWHEISDDNFIIVYPESYEKQADKVLEYADSAYIKLSGILGFDIKGKIIINISNCSDSYFSSASIFPSNRIKLNLIQPKPDRIYAVFKNRTRFAVSKQLAKIFLSNIEGGPINFLRKIFGNHPLLSPLLMTPSPLIEGFSTYLGLMINKEKLPDELFTVLGLVADAGLFPKMSMLSGNYSNWPVLYSKFMFGAGFVLFLSKKFSTESLIDFIKSYAIKPIKFSTDKRLEVYLPNRSLKLWDEYITRCKKYSKVKNLKMVSIDSSGMLQRYPVFLRTGEIAYLKNDFMSTPRIKIHNRGDEIILNRGIFGISYDENENALYYSQIINTNPYYEYSDIFKYDVSKKKVSQLSFGKRLFEPVKIKNKSDILCVQREKDKEYIVIYNIRTRKAVKITESFTGISHPEISPNNKFIIASVKTEGSYWRIGVFDKSGSFIRFLTDGVHSYYPSWKNENEIFYISKYGNVNTLFSYNFDNNKYYIYEDLKNIFLKYFAFSNKGKEIALTYINEKGYNTAIFNYTDLKKLDFNCEVIKQEFVNNVNNEKKIKKNRKIREKKYNHLRDLIPRYFTPTYNIGGKEVQPGIMTSARDIVDRNEYEINLFYGFIKKKISYDLKYKYRGFYQFLEFKTFDKYSLNNNPQTDNFLLRTIGSQVLVEHPFIKNENHKLSFVFDIHFERIISEDMSGDSSKEIFIDNKIINSSYNGFSLSLNYKSSKQYYESISNDDGFNFSLVYSKDLKFLGSNYNANSMFFEYKHFISIFRPNVFSLRLAVFKSLGKFRRRIFMGGAETASINEPMKNKFFGLMRGFPAGYFYGSLGYLLNIEYRFSLLKIENTLLFLPYLERIYLTVFSDIGKLVDNNSITNPSYSYGFEFNVKFNLGNPITIALGIAKGVNPSHKYIAYLRLENSF